MKLKGRLFLLFLSFPLFLLGQGVSMLPSNLPETLLGSWIDEKNNISLILRKDYLVIDNELWYYNEIIKENETIYFTAVRNFNVKYIHISEIDSASVLLDEGYKIRKLTKPNLNVVQSFPKSMFGNWYNSKKKLKILNNELVYLDKHYTLDYFISTDKTHNYFVLYNEGEYYFCYNFKTNDGRFLNTNFSEEIIFKEESFISKYFLAFVAVCCISLLILGYFLFKWKIALAKKKEVKKRKFIEMQLKSFRSQMNPHFLFNALSAIQNLINKGHNDKANHYLTEFSQLMRLTLDKSEKGLVPLLDEIESIKKYLELEKLRFSFDYVIHLESEIDLQQTEIPAMLVQPFVENAIVHGLVEVSGKRKLSIGFKVDGENMICLIRDNGIGIKASLAKRVNGFRRESFGLKLAEDRIKLINESYNANANIRITDLSELDDSKTGTLVEIFIPIWY